MRKVIFKLLFYIVAAAWAWVFFLYPPKWLMSLSLPAYVIITVLWGLLCVYFYTIQKILTSFSPKKMEIIPAPEKAPIDKLCEFSECLTSLGFVPAGPACKIGELPSLSMTFVHEESATYGTIMNVEHPLVKKKFFDFVSHMKGYHGHLGTFSDAKQASFSVSPGSWCQAFQDANPTSLY